MATAVAASWSVEDMVLERGPGTADFYGGSAQSGYCTHSCKDDAPDGSIGPFRPLDIYCWLAAEEKRAGRG